jgi:acetolactate synthase-1/2/3 large subunit
MSIDAEGRVRAATRTGGSLVVESLEALGAEAVFGLPGTHVLPIWEALRTSSLRYVGFRTELNAGFAADGYARTSGEPAVLALTTGPGALMSLAALMEAASAHVPVVAIAGQIPADLIGRGRGYLHELRDQRASFEPVVKWTATARRAEAIPELLAEGWRRAQTPPSGPVFIEVPTDVLQTPAPLPRVEAIDGTPPPARLPPPGVLEEAAHAVNESERPVIWAGGGVLRSGAWAELRELAERLRAPVATTYMGKGAFPEDDPLSAGSACDEPAFHELLRGADILVCVGTELGAETTAHYSLELPRLVHVDAAEERIGKNYPALGLVGDARATLSALAERLRARERDGAGEARAAAVRTRVDRGLAGQGRELERGMLAAVRSVLPRAAVSAWDMTIPAYWAAAHFPVLEPRRFLYPLGSGTLGYAWPAALGAALSAPETATLAVVGDGGVLYGVQELATARQHGLAATLLIVDDGGYGILREHQLEEFGETYAVDLEQPDFPALVDAFGVPVEQTTPDGLGDSLARALAVDGPAVVYLPARLGMWSPTA